MIPGNYIMKRKFANMIHHHSKERMSRKRSSKLLVKYVYLSSRSKEAVKARMISEKPEVNAQTRVKRMKSDLGST